MESAFSDGPKAITESIKDQKKKKTIFTVERSFPFVLNRLAIISEESVYFVYFHFFFIALQIVLSPIENAIELIEGRIEAIKAQFEYNPPRTNQLQQVLQGSIVPSIYSSFWIQQFLFIFFFSGE